MFDGVSVVIVYVVYYVLVVGFKVFCGVIGELVFNVVVDRDVVVIIECY